MACSDTPVLVVFVGAFVIAAINGLVAVFSDNTNKKIAGVIIALIVSLLIFNARYA